MKKTILVVDDEEDNRVTLQALLEREGYRVMLAASGHECLESLKITTPDVILMDIIMPGLTTREILPKIKNIKVLIFSVVSLSENEKKELQEKWRNIHGFIEKPFDTEILVEIVRKTLKS